MPDQRSYARNAVAPFEDEQGPLVRELRAEAVELRAALDNVQSGVLLLDRDLRATYSNSALHRMFAHTSPEYIREVRPLYRELLRAASDLAAVDMEDYIRRRLDWVRSGDATPMDLRMNSGAIVRCSVAALPEGGRMLIYSDVTDIVRASEELERLATIDGMTGIYNRRHFMDLADHEWMRARRHNAPITFLMIDIDRFKRINDTFGHQVGDAVIVHLARLASACKRASDVLARVGGEEFALLLPETDLGEGTSVAERLRLEVLRAKPQEAPFGAMPTISVGVASATPDMADISALMRAADNALYEAKRTGRNRVVCMPEAA